MELPVFYSKKDQSDNGFEPNTPNPNVSRSEFGKGSLSDAEGQKILQEIMHNRTKSIYSMSDGEVSENENGSVLSGVSGNMTVGPGVRMEGAIRHFENLMILGSSEGELEGENLTIGEGGWLKGTATIRNMEIVGQFQGTAIVAGHVHLRSTGTIEGTITYSSIEIENGGQISGEMHPAKQSEETEITGKEFNSSDGVSLVDQLVQFPEPSTVK